MTEEISDEVDALLKFYSGRKLISIRDIREFSRVYRTVQERLKDFAIFNDSNDQEGK